MIDRASQALRAIHVEGVFSELADRLDSSAPICPTWVFSLSGEVDNEASVEDLDAINGRIHELDEPDPPVGAGIVRRDHVEGQGRIRFGGFGRLAGKRSNSWKPNAPNCLRLRKKPRRL